MREQGLEVTPEAPATGVGHIQGGAARDCPNCGAPPREQEIRNYSMMWHDGDVHCTRCGAYVRMRDAG